MALEQERIFVEGGKAILYGRWTQTAELHLSIETN